MSPASITFAARPVTPYHSNQSRPQNQLAVTFRKPSPERYRERVNQMELKAIEIARPAADVNVIVGQAHFIKTVEDLHEAMVGVSSSLRFGLAFCEASGPRLVRRTGNDPELVELATRNALAIAAGHCFVIFLRDGFPVNILNPVKAVPEVCTIYCATANPVDILVAVTPRGRGIVGVVDGQAPLGVETDRDVADRRDLLRAIGYKL
jgi:adenosine/AMP kinase